MKISNEEKAQIFGFAEDYFSLIRLDLYTAASLQGLLAGRRGSVPDADEIEVIIAKALEIGSRMAVSMKKSDVGGNA